MTRGLRKQHRRVFALLVLVLPAAFIVGIVARREVPMVAELPPAFASSIQTFSATEIEWRDLFPRSPVRTRL